MAIFLVHPNLEEIEKKIEFRVEWTSLILKYAFWGVNEMHLTDPANLCGWQKSFGREPSLGRRTSTLVFCIRSSDGLILKSRGMLEYGSLMMGSLSTTSPLHPRLWMRICLGKVLGRRTATSGKLSLMGPPDVMTLSLISQQQLVIQTYFFEALLLVLLLSWI